MTKSKKAQPADTIYDQLYTILKSAFHRADSAARAVAALEHEIAEEVRVYSATEAEEDEVDQLEYSAQESSRDFDDRRFHDIFDRLNLVKLISEISELLELDDCTRKELLSTVIGDQFGPGSKEPQHPRKNIGRKTLIGDDLGVFLHHAKQTAAREQASRRRNGQ